MNFTEYKIVELKGLGYYKTSRKFWVLTNELFGPAFLFMYVSSLTYYSLIERLLEWSSAGFVLLVFLENFLIYGISGHIHYKVFFRKSVVLPKIFVVAILKQTIYFSR